MQKHYYVVDVFTNERFAGNPAAVITDATGLSDEQMQSIAAEFNLSETTFILPVRSQESPSFQFRWFTPTVEVDMCGHATIAGVHALVESGVIRHDDPTASTSVDIQTRSGLLTAFVESIPNIENPQNLPSGGRMLWLDLISPTLTPIKPDLFRLAEILNVTVDAFDAAMPPVQTQDQDMLIFVKDVMTMNDVRPDFAKLDTWLTKQNLRGMSVATVKTLSPAIHVQSRFFAPPAGVNEDAVTGSVHGPLAVYLVKNGIVSVKDDLAGMTCVQGIAGGRAGMLHALVQPERDGNYNVRIGGQAVTVMKGELYL